MGLFYSDVRISYVTAIITVYGLSIEIFIPHIK